MQVYTDIKTLKKSWNLLKDLELETLLTGEKVDVDIVKLLNSLLADSKLNEFCQIITKTDVDFEEMELKEVSEIVSGFFTGIAGSLQMLMPAINVPKPQAAKQPSLPGQTTPSGT